MEISNWIFSSSINLKNIYGMEAHKQVLATNTSKFDLSTSLTRSRLVLWCVTIRVLLSGCCEISKIARICNAFLPRRVLISISLNFIIAS